MNGPPPVDQLIRDAERGIAGAQYNLGVCYLRGDGVEADAVLACQWLSRAAEAGLAPAQSALGFLFLRAHGVDYDAKAATALFRRAAEQDFVEAIYKYAEALATGLGCDADADAARETFARAARAGHPLAQCQLAYCLDEGIGGPVEPGNATTQLFHAASAGVPRAMAAIGQRYRTGHTLPQDPPRALAWFLRAAAAQFPGADDVARRLRTALNPEDVRTAEALASAAPDTGPVDPGRQVERPAPHVEALSESPFVQRIHNLLSPEERWHLVALATPHLRPSKVLSSRSGEMVQAGGRSSGGMSVIEPLRDVVVHRVEQRLAELTGVPAVNGEPLVVLRYGPGDEYRPHFDFFDPAIPGQATALANGGQRQLTVLVYLNAVESGGETEFPDAGLRFAPEPGTGLLFRNTLADGSIDRASRHAGCPVVTGTKWLATKWLRETAFDEFCD